MGSWRDALRNGRTRGSFARGRRRGVRPSVSLARSIFPSSALAPPELVESAGVIVAELPTLHAKIGSLEAAGHLLTEGHPLFWSQGLGPAKDAPSDDDVALRVQAVAALAELLGPKSGKVRELVLLAVAERHAP